MNVFHKLFLNIQLSIGEWINTILQQFDYNFTLKIYFTLFEFFKYPCYINLRLTFQALNLNILCFLGQAKYYLNKKSFTVKNRTKPTFKRLLKKKFFFLSKKIQKIPVTDMMVQYNFYNSHFKGEARKFEL